MDAILDLLPLDYFVESPAGHMAPQEGAIMPPAGEEVIAAAATIVTKHADGVSLVPIDRFDFYTQARRCFAVVQTLERRPCVSWSRSVDLWASSSLPVRLIQWLVSPPLQVRQRDPDKGRGGAGWARSEAVTTCVTMRDAYTNTC